MNYIFKVIFIYLWNNTNNNHNKLINKVGNKSRYLTYKNCIKYL